MSLPPLPKPTTFQLYDGGEPVQAYTTAAVLEYGQACRKQALEEAALQCEKAVLSINACLKSVGNETAASALSYRALMIKELIK